MDKSFIEILKAVANQIDNTELSAAVKADMYDGEYALSEDGLESAKKQVSSLLTLDSAINNPEVIERINKESYPKHMKTALSKVEGKLKPLYDKLGIDYSNSEFLSDKIEDLEAKISESLSKGDNKSVIDALNSELRESKALLENKDQEFKKQLEEKEQSFKNEKIKDKFFLEANNYTWADAYSEPDLKLAILEKKWEKINAKAHLMLDNGEFRLMQKDMPDKELYNGNKIATFQSLLEPELEPYLKKSSPEKVNKSEPKPSEAREEMSAKKIAMIEQRKRYQMDN